MCHSPDKVVTAGAHRPARPIRPMAMPHIPLAHSLRVLALAGLPLLAVALARVAAEVPVGLLTRDPLSGSGKPPLSGALSSLGVLLWWAGASACALAAWCLHRTGQHEQASFLAHTAGLSAYLALDDLFQIHETLAPRWLGLPEHAVYGLIALATAIYLWRHRRQWAEPDAGLLGIALLGLALSVALDAVLGRWLWRLDEWQYLVEDGFKWIGICFWTSFCFRRSAALLRPHRPA